MKKSELRKIGKQALLDMPQELRAEKETSIHQQLFDTRQWNRAQSIGVTISQPHEWSTKAIIEKAWKEKKTVLVPKCDPTTKQMQFYQLTDYNQLETVYFGLKEPDPVRTNPVSKNEIDLLLVPGLLFDESGYRIGYGGGYYDRFLADFESETLMIASDLQKHMELPVDSYDLPVDHVLTESGLYTISKS